MPAAWTYKLFASQMSSTCGLTAVHVPAGVGQLTGQLHILVGLLALNRACMSAKGQHARHKASQVVHLVLVPTPAERQPPLCLRL